MKTTTVIVSIQTQEKLPKYIEKLNELLEMGCSAAIIDTGGQNNQDTVVSSSVSYIHCPDEKEVIVTYNTLLDENLKTENDILLMDEGLLLSLPADSSFYQEMQDVLYYTEKHAFVSPRICTTDDSRYYLEQLKRLPRFSILAEPDSRCVLIKSSVIGLLCHFDTRYLSFKYALLDLVLRANQFGYNPVLSNHGFLNDTDAYTRFTIDSNIDQEIFVKRYPYFSKSKELISAYEKHPFEAFLGLFAEENAKKKILLNYMILQPLHYGPTEFMLSFLESFYRLFREKYEIFVYTNYAANRFHRLSERYPNVLFPDTLSGVFDIGFFAGQPFFLEDQFFLNKHCLKSIFTMFDIIPWRSYSRRNEQMLHINDVIRLGFLLCDGVIAISDFSIQDYKAYFYGDMEIQKKPVKRVYISSSFASSAKKKYGLPFSDYYLIAGSEIKYKALSETIDIVANSHHQFIVIGHGNSNYIKDNVFGYAGGHISEDFLVYLYANCKAVIFPSVYEGFGLPIVNALKNKKRVIVYDYALNREIYEHFNEFKEFFLFFNNFSQIGEILNDIDFSIEPTPVEYKDSWDHTATEIEAFIEEILEKEVEEDRLKERWHLLNLLEVKMNESRPSLPRLRSLLLTAVKNKVRYAFPKLYAFLKRFIRK